MLWHPDAMHTLGFCQLYRVFDETGFCGFVKRHGDTDLHAALLVFTPSDCARDFGEAK